MHLPLVRHLVVTALLFSIGGHWVVLQSAAWTGMLVKFALQESVASALTKTFDGQHPCSLCKVVEHGTKSPAKAPQRRSDAIKKLNLFTEAQAEPAIPPFLRLPAPSLDGRNGAARPEDPPVPPPRRV